MAEPCAQDAQPLCSPQTQRPARGPWGPEAALAAQVSYPQPPWGCQQEPAGCPPSEATSALCFGPSESYCSQHHHPHPGVDLHPRSARSCFLCGLTVQHSALLASEAEGGWFVHTGTEVTPKRLLVKKQPLEHLFLPQKMMMKLESRAHAPTCLSVVSCLCGECKEGWDSGTPRGPWHHMGHDSYS